MMHFAHTDPEINLWLRWASEWGNTPIFVRAVASLEKTNLRLGQRSIPAYHQVLGTRDRSVWIAPSSGPYDSRPAVLPAHLATQWHASNYIIHSGPLGGRCARNQIQTV